MHADNLRRGALLMLASGLLFSAMGALVKTIRFAGQRLFSEARLAK
ncbi:MAG: hypothetical protein Tsb0026_18850 [Sulfuricaulis sp.]